MTDPRDEIDTWLEHDVTPLMPRSGSLDRIRRTARRRKATQAVLATAGCAVVVAAAVTVPQLIGGRSPTPGNPAPAVAGGSSVPKAGPSASATGGTDSSGSKHLRLNQRTTLSTTTSGGSVPADFRPTSVTFVGTQNGSGGVVGAVLGQAGDAAHPCASSYCTSLAGTSDYGAKWYGVSAPLTGAASGPAGVSQLRFATLKDGWAFGPQLWETSGGGWPWTREDTGGLRVTDLETTSSRAFAIFARCAGTGPDYATACTSFSLYSSAAGSTTWAPVAVPPAFRHMRTAIPASASLFISGGTVTVLTPTGQVLRGPASGTGAWTVTGQAPCVPGAAQASGFPAEAQLAAWPSLVLACDTSTATGYQSTIYTSADGASWAKAGVAATNGASTSLGVGPDGRLVLATTAGLYFSADHGKTWHAARVTGAPSGGFGYTGMTTSTAGVAVPADAAAGEVFVTADGGRSWTPSRISG